MNGLLSTYEKVTTLLAIWHVVADYGFDMSPAAESDAIDRAMREIVEINPIRNLDSGSV